MHFFIHILQILGSISLFIFAIKFLSENLQALSSSNFKRTLNQITYNNTSSIIAGTLFTSAIQSSSAASVFILGFVNTGIINLKKAFALILGANIGTTLTLLVIYFGIKFDFLMIALPILFVSFPFYISKKRNYRKWGGIFIALSFLFIAIHFLKLYLPNFENLGINEFILGIDDFGIFTKIGFILLGILLTSFVHFSSASITIAILLADKGLPIELGAMIVLGANIGTTITAHLVAAIGNYQTKIVAAFYTLFNVGCACIFLILGSYLIQFIHLFSTNKIITLISFDIITNIIGVIVVFPFINIIAEYCQKKFNSYQEEDNKKIEFFSIPFSSNSDLYRNEANKKMIRLAGTTRQIIHTLGRMITESDEEKMAIFRERIYQLEKDGDDLELEVKELLNDIASLDLPNENIFEVHQLITLCHHLESVGDIAIKISSLHRKRRVTNSYFTPKMRDFLVILQNNLDQATTILNQNLNDNNYEISIREAEMVEKYINTNYKDAENNLLKTIEKEKLGTMSALYYKEIIQHYEQLGDHIYRANKTIVKLNQQ
ncbi:Na/Pi cotransporter family protein [Faecalibacter rhinopitheci]|uniref:Na/Pi cotransporter family protein n=1 Tax=Faecalibacter rhinopitheci TaxID=2779678 RepID=A0A8J7FU75_9FLAO|nr:Na/Pi symporter [Faecalibacter rhinopitheci]MBF0596441.1 Na/Pi cotransporter family protein [Faecalibacter rhinopitheci]